MDCVNAKEVNVYLFDSKIYGGKPIPLPEEFNLEIKSVSRRPRQNIIDVFLECDLRKETSTPTSKKNENLSKSYIETIKSFLEVKIDDIEDCHETLEVFGCLNSSPNIKSKVSDYLNGKQDGFLEVLEFLVNLDT